MLNRIEDFLIIYSENKQAINFVIYCLLTLLFSGFYTIYLYRGRKLRKVVRVWIDLVEELNEKILTLSGQLSVSRIALIGARSELAECLEHGRRKDNKIEELFTEIEKLNDELSK